MRIENRRGIAGNDFPEAQRDFIGQLLRRPSHISGIHARLRVFRNLRFLRNHINIAQNAYRPGGFDAGSNQRACAERDRSAEVDRFFARTIENQSHDAIAIRMDQNNYGARKIGIVRFFRRGQKRARGRQIRRSDLLRERNQQNYSWHINTIFPLTEARSSISCARPAPRNGRRSATTG